MRIEVRACIHCGEEKEIPQPKGFARNICKECRNKRSNQYNTAKAIANGRKVGQTGRVPYPLPEGFKTTNEYFRSLAKETFSIKNREQSIELMRTRLNETLEKDNVMKWINGHEEDKPKRITQIKKDYPDTRYITWEEYQKGLGDDEVDS
jgi:hypothetical protein